MCMLFVKKAGVQLCPRQIDSLWDYNPDGGVTWNTKTGKLFRTLSEGQFKKHLLASTDDELVIHFRLGTSGKATIEQTHGFDIGGGAILFHNGILNTFEGDNTKSDTQQFVDWILKNMLTPAQVKAYVEKHETTSRFVIGNRLTGEVVVPNCAKWSGCLLSGEEVPQLVGSVLYSNNYAIDSGWLYGVGKRPSRKRGYSHNYGSGCDYTHHQDYLDEQSEYVERQNLSRIAQKEQEEREWKEWLGQEKGLDDRNNISAQLFEVEQLIQSGATDEDLEGYFADHPKVAVLWVRHSELLY